MKDKALKLALEALENSQDFVDASANAKLKTGWGEQLDKADKAIATIKEALAQEQEPVAWRTFDGEGGYDYRSYEDNESYADDWNKRNPNHAKWVDKLYTKEKNNG